MVLFNDNSLLTYIDNYFYQDGTSPVAYDYYDFGVTISIGYSTFFNEVCYTGGIYDVSIGLYYLNARYYAHKNGRNISKLIIY